MDRKLIIHLFIAFFLIINPVKVKAIDNTATNNSQFEMQNELIDEQFLEMKILNEEIKTYPIISFDVSNINQILVGMENGYLNIYDTNGNYLKGFKFNIDGWYAVEWNDNDSFFIYFLRYNKALQASLNGEILKTYTIPDTAYNQQIRDNIDSKDEVIKNDIAYYKNSDCIIKVENDSKSLIVEVKEYAKKETLIFSLMATVCLIVIVLIFVISKSKFKSLLFRNY